MFDLWFTNLMYVSDYPYGVNFTDCTWKIYFECKEASNQQTVYWNN